MLSIRRILFFGTLFYLNTAVLCENLEQIFHGIKDCNTLGTTEEEHINPKHSEGFRLTKILDLHLDGKSDNLESNINTIFKSELSQNDDVSRDTLVDVIKNYANQTRLENYYKDADKILKSISRISDELSSQLSKLQPTPSQLKINSDDETNGFKSRIGVSYKQSMVRNGLNTNRSLPKSCKDILEKDNNSQSGIYRIQPKTSPKSFVVLCDMETKGGGWTHIQKRFDGSQDFYLEWRDYKFGFGDLEGEFWLGLEHIYKMTGLEVNELLIEIEDRNEKKAYALYKVFSIGSESEGYALNTLKGFSGDAGDSLSSHLNQKFTTKDFDQDNHAPGNCAQLFSGAWWYNACHVSNLNGKYLNKPLPTAYQYQGMHWKEFGGHEYSHAKSRMLVRTP